MSQNRCLIKGKVIDRPLSKVLWIHPINSDFRVVKPIQVAIDQDGSFSSVIDFGVSELYSITFKDEVLKGGWRPINFMLENRIIEFELHPMERFEDNKIAGGELNDQFLYLSQELAAQYTPQIDQLLSQLNDLGVDSYSDEYRNCIDSISIKELIQDEKSKIYRRMDQLRSQNRQYSREGNEKNEQLEKIAQKIEDQRVEAIKGNPNEASLAMLYYMMGRNLRANSAKKEMFEDLYHHTKDKTPLKWRGHIKNDGDATPQENRTII